MGNSESKSKSLTPGKTPFLIQPEQIKDSKRMITRASRKIGRERGKLEREREKAKKEVIKLAKAGKHVRNTSLTSSGPCQNHGEKHGSDRQNDRANLYGAISTPRN